MGACELDEDTKAKVLRQVEFYFSDSNLPGDNFLVTTIEENEDGLISLPLVCSFTRMRGHLGLKEHGADSVPAEVTAAVAEVLRGSTFLKISEDGCKVGRLHALKSPETARAEVDSRSIAANPLPFDIKLDDVEVFFKKHATVRSVRLPRIPGVGAFSGYATVELDSVEEAQRVLTLKLELHGVPLEFETKKAFDERQALLSAQNGQKNGQMRRNNFGGRSGEDQDRFPKNRVVSFTVRKCSEKAAPSTDISMVESEREKVEKADDSGATEHAVAVESTDGKEADGAAKVEAKLSIEAQVAREDIKGALEIYGTVVFIDYSRGEESGYARFDEEEAARQARAGAVMAAEGGLPVKGHILTLEAVEGEAEKEYWKKVREAQDRVREGGGRGYGDRGRDGGGRGYGDRGRDGGGRGFGDHGRGRGRMGRGRGGRGRGRSRDGDGDEKNNGVAKGKHMRFDDGEETQEKKLARTE